MGQTIFGLALCRRQHGDHERHVGGRRARSGVGLHPDEQLAKTAEFANMLGVKPMP
jgi:hypothetical protein